MEKSVGLFKSTQSATWQKEKEGKANEQESLQKKKERVFLQLKTRSSSKNWSLKANRGIIYNKTTFPNAMHLL